MKGGGGGHVLLPVEKNNYMFYVERTRFKVTAYVRNIKSYVRDIKSYVRDTKSYVRDTIKSCVRYTKSYVRDNQSYVRDCVSKSPMQSCRSFP